MAIMGLGPRYVEDVKRLESKCTAAEHALWPPDRPRDDFLKQMRGRREEPEALAALIVYAWRIHNIKYPRLRPLILIIYSFGFLLLGIPATVTFFQVTFFGFRHLLSGG
jgi:hypothetical protein